MSLRRVCDRCPTADKDKFKKKGMLRVQVIEGCFADEPEEGAVIVSKTIDLCDDCLNVVPGIIKDQLLGESGDSLISDDVPVHHQDPSPTTAPPPEPTTTPKTTAAKATAAPAPKPAATPSASPDDALAKAQELTGAKPAAPSAPKGGLKPGAVNFDAGGVPGDDGEF